MTTPRAIDDLRGITLEAWKRLIKKAPLFIKAELVSDGSEDEPSPISAAVLDARLCISDVEDKVGEWERVYHSLENRLNKAEVLCAELQVKVNKLEDPHQVGG